MSKTCLLLFETIEILVVSAQRNIVWKTRLVVGKKTGLVGWKRRFKNMNVSLQPAFVQTLSCPFAMCIKALSSIISCLHPVFNSYSDLFAVFQPFSRRYPAPIQPLSIPCLTNMQLLETCWQQKKCFLCEKICFLWTSRKHLFFP